MNRVTRIILIVSIIAIVYGVGIYFIIEESRQCDTQVTLTDGESYECRDVHSYDSGVSRIKLCDDTSFDVPTLRIKKITRK